LLSTFAPAMSLLSTSEPLAVATTARPFVAPLKLSLTTRLLVFILTASLSMTNLVFNLRYSHRYA
jgi:hypothetical protein